MTDKKLLEAVKNGAIFFVQYGKTTFTGTLLEFAKSCKNFVDYAKKPNNYFGFSVWSDGHAYEVQKGFKSLLLEAVK